MPASGSRINGGGSLLHTEDQGPFHLKAAFVRAT
jgi:hypothetical protein